MVVQRHPVLGTDRLGGDEAAVSLRVVRTEPALGRAVAVEVYTGPAGVGDLHLEDVSLPQRLERCDHELAGGAGLAVLGVHVGAGHLRAAGRREGVVAGATDLA
jgi:hypothetical protein